MSDRKNSMDMSEVATNLPASDREALWELPAKVAALPPKVQKRVQKLRELQSHHNELEAKFLEEKAILEAKYQKLYEPLYTKRYEIVNGTVEVDGVATDAAKQAEENGSEEKGVPNFWLNAMKSHQILAEEITEHDEEALKYLKDIKWCWVDDPKGFMLEFFFHPNPFFKNTVLTKIYHMFNDHDDDEPILEKAIGTNIDWNSGKCLTQKLLKKKPKKGAKPIIKREKCESFFNFFSPPEVPDDDDDDLDEDDVDELENQMELDYEIGSIIRDKIISHAVSWFTGEAKDDDCEDSTEEEEEEDDDDNDEDKDKEDV